MSATADLAELDDGALARRVAESAAESAQAELYTRFARRVELYGLKHLGDADEAEDLVQETLQTVLAKLRAGEVREPEKIASFVLGTARQLVRGKRRTESRRFHLLTRYGDPEARAEPTEGWGAMVERLVGCLAALGDRHKTVLVLSFYGELSAAEIADELGTTSGNVRVLRHRGIEQLTRCVQGEGAT